MNLQFDHEGQSSSHYERYLLSYGQQALWYTHQLAPDSTAYNTAFAASIYSSVDVPALRQTWQALLDRHGALRTTFTLQAGVPVQEVHGSQDVDFLHLDATDESDAALKDRVLAAYRQPFDIAQGKLCRVRLFTQSAERHVMLFVAHHLVIDAWSQWRLLEEFRQLYPALQAGSAAPLPPPPPPYRDYVQWQAEMLQREGERLGAYWHDRLAGDLPILHLPTDRPRPPVQTFHGMSEAVRLPDDCRLKLHRLALQAKATMYMTLLAAFQVLLQRYTGQDDILVGSPVTDRPWSGFHDTVGDFVDMQVMRADMSGNPAFTTFLNQVRQTVFHGLLHPGYPFRLLAERLQQPRDPSYPPLFQVAFVLDQPPPELASLLRDDPEQRVEWGGLSLAPYEFGQQEGQFDLVLILIDAGDTLFGWLRYNTDLFDASTIRRMAGHFQVLLEAILANPEARIRDLPWLTAAEHRQLLVKWNDTRTAYPNDTVHRLFEQQAARTPDAVALVCEAQQLTYRELNARANQVAHALQRHGVGPETCVGLCMERSLEMVAGLLGILKAGGAYVPINPADPAERLTFMRQDTQVPVILTQSHLRPMLHPLAPSPCLDIASVMPGHAKVNPRPSTAPHNLAYVMYTSGSTGVPKGVCVTHRNIVRLVKETNFAQLSPAETFLQLAPISFDASTLEIWGPLLSGGRLVVMPPHNPSLEELGQAIRQYQVTTLWLTAGLFHLMVDHRLEDLRPLRQLLAGGDVLSVPHVRNVIQHLPTCQLINGYGPTENTTFTCCFPIGAADHLGPSVPIGRPVSNTQVYLLDSALQPVPIGVAGELYTGGDGVARGYHRRARLTAGKFLPNPFGEGRLYRTGDLARYRPDGTIEFLGRLDNQVKLRGFRIELGEIESVLSQHPTVQDAVVMVREAQTNDKRLVAYVVARSGLDDPEGWREFLRQKLPDHMIPSAFVQLEALPLTTNGKVDRGALPAPGIRHLEASQMPPRTPTEEVLSAIWAGVLGVEQVGVHDNFFELGGHSLLATQIISRVRDTFQAELPVRTVFEAATIGELAQVLEMARQRAQARPGLPPIEASPRDGDVPLSFAQQRLWFLDQLEGPSTTYNVPLALRLQGPLSVSLLEEALQALGRRHEVLRTTFPVIEGQPVQQVNDNTLSLTLVDLQRVSEPEQAAELDRLLAQEMACTFDLARGPLMHVTLYRLGHNDHVLMLTMHHMITDGWSLGIMLRELDVLYRASAAGDPAPLPELPLQYADFSQWQRQWLQGGVLADQLAYWRQHLADAPPLLELPTDRARPAVQRFQGRMEPFTIAPALIEALRDLSRQSGVSLFMTLYAAVAVLLSRYSGQTDLVLGTPIANRHYQAIEPLIGFFVNTLALRVDLSGNPTFAELLKRVRQVTLAGYAHQDIPFEQLLRALEVERDLSHTPLFQVMFVYETVRVEPVAFGDVMVSQLAVESQTAKFDLTFFLGESEASRGLWGMVEYNTDLFEQATVRRLINHFQQVLAGVVAGPQPSINALPLLTAAERQQLLTGLNDTRMAHPTDRFIHQLIEAQAERTPDAVAVVSRDERPSGPAFDQSVFPPPPAQALSFPQAALTYAELNRRANQLAHYLRQLGVGPEVIVAVYLERSIRMIVASLGILKAGGAYAPIDPSHPAERVAFMLDDTQAPVLLTESHLAEQLPAHRVRVIDLERDWPVIAQASPANPVNLTTADHLAYIIYTSGSTGMPKGVQITHGALLNFTFWHRRTHELNATDHISQCSGLSFDATIIDIWPCLSAGATLCLPMPDVLLSPIDLQAWFITYGITKGFVTTAIAERLVDLAWPATSPLQILLTGGEALHRVPTPDQTFALINGYGPTENTAYTTTYRCLPSDDPSDVMPPIGRPLDNVDVYIVDAQLQPVPIGVYGELYIGGASLARGYLSRPALTAERFLPNPFSSDEAGAVMYRTGDIVRYLPNGDIEFLGRTDDQIKIRGFRVELGEIEAALAAHSHLQAATVLAWDAGERAGDKRLIAYVVPDAATGPIDPSQLRQHLLQKLPDYMVPSAFVTLDALPFTTNGKVNRSALPAPEAALDALGPMHSTAYIPPRTPTETALATIWGEVLGLEKVGIQDDFFTLGGHSLLATQVVSRSREAFDMSLPVSVLFERPTITELAGFIDAAQPRDPEGQEEREAGEI